SFNLFDCCLDRPAALAAAIMNSRDRYALNLTGRAASLRLYGKVLISRFAIKPALRNGIESLLNRLIVRSSDRDRFFFLVAFGFHSVDFGQNPLYRFDALATAEMNAFYFHFRVSPAR